MHLLEQQSVKLYRFYPQDQVDEANYQMLIKNEFKH